jgi:hypothetical protein
MHLLPTILKQHSSNEKVVFAGTDPGVVTMSTTIPKTLEEVCADINRFQVLSTEDCSDTETVPCLFDVKQLPKSNKITAGMIDNAAFKRHHQRKQQRRKTNGVDIETLQRKMNKERREREIRTKWAYNKIAAQERRRIHTHAQPSGKPAPTIIHCFGRWQSTNSPIKGYSRRSTKKIREQHRAYGYVGLTDEYNTSKVCPYCFSKVILHRAHRIVNGMKKIVHLNGAIECVNPQCPARRIGYTTRGRDANAAANIALSGASIILAADRRPLPCYRRDSNQPSYKPATHLLTVATPEASRPLVHPGYIREE